MAYTLEVSYFNCVILKPDTSITQQPSSISGDTITVSTGTGDWHVEESRIKGGFNEDSMGYGVKAYITDENYKLNHRPNAMIYSGIFNSRTKTNQTNEFPNGLNITRAVDIANGSIQKLHAEDTNLIIFQEDKVNRALIDKDAIFTAEGQRLSIQGAEVIGQILPYSGRFGISKNPESFSVYGNRKYFTDKSRGIVLRLSQDGITPISNYGMNDYFRDNLKSASVIYGIFDEHHKNYVLSLQNDSTSFSKTLTFDDSNNGWTSFHSYSPNDGFSLNSKYYTFHDIDIWEHYSNNDRNTFYDSYYVSTIDLIANASPSVVKNFHTINYEGTSGWKMNSSVTDSSDSAYTVLSNDTTTVASSIPINFVRKEDKYYGHLRNNTTTTTSGQVIGVDVSGIKGVFTELQLENGSTSAAELFSVSHGVSFSSN